MIPQDHRVLLPQVTYHTFSLGKVGGDTLVVVIGEVCVDGDGRLIDGFQPRFLTTDGDTIIRMQVDDVFGVLAVHVNCAVNGKSCSIVGVWTFGELVAFNVYGQKAAGSDLLKQHAVGVEEKPWLLPGDSS